jgi:hypothetical protein
MNFYELLKGDQIFFEKKSPKLIPNPCYVKFLYKSYFCEKRRDFYG